MTLFELTDFDWSVIQLLLPSKPRRVVGSMPAACLHDRDDTAFIACRSKTSSTAC